MNNERHTIPDFPLIGNGTATLRVVGNADLLVSPDKRFLVDGARRSTPAGDRDAAAVAKEIVTERNGILVSGGSRGTHAAALRSALMYDGKCIVVIGTGLDHIYPQEHEQLFDMVVEDGGAIVSMFEDNVSPRPGNFPRRNQVIASLVGCMVAIECARRGGCYQMAKLLTEANQGAFVYARPASVESHLNGTNYLIRDAHAEILVSLSDRMHYQEPHNQGVTV
jgi:DNA processing protein